MNRYWKFVSLFLSALIIGGSHRDHQNDAVALNRSENPDHPHSDPERAYHFVSREGDGILQAPPAPPPIPFFGSTFHTDWHHFQRNHRAAYYTNVLLPSFSSTPFPLSSE